MIRWLLSPSMPKNLDACDSGGAVGRSPHHQRNSLCFPTPFISACGSGVNVPWVSRVEVFQRSQGFQGSRAEGFHRFQRVQGYQGFKGTIFSLSKLNYAERHRTCTSNCAGDTFVCSYCTATHERCQTIVHSLRTNPNGLVRPLIPLNSLSPTLD